MYSFGVLDFLSFEMSTSLSQVLSRDRHNDPSQDDRHCSINSTTLAHNHNEDSSSNQSSNDNSDEHRASHTCKGVPVRSRRFLDWYIVPSVCANLLWEFFIRCPSSTMMYCHSVFRRIALSCAAFVHTGNYFREGYKS